MTSFTWKPFCYTCYLCSLGLAWTVCSSSGVCCTCVVAPFCSAYARAWLVLLVAFTVLSTFLVALGELARIALFCGVHAFSLHRVLLYPQRWLSLLCSLLGLCCLLPLLCFVAHIVFVVGVSGFLAFLSLFALFALAAWLALILSCCLASFLVIFTSVGCPHFVCLLINLLCLLTCACSA